MILPQIVELGVLNMISAIAVSPAVILSFCFSVEVAAGLRPLPRRQDAFGQPAPSAVIIVPAHNEAAAIAATMAALSAEAAGIADLLIVADNCTDRTAQIVRDGGVRCVVRTAPHARGKGYALAFARDELAKSRPDVVMVVDADCRIDRASIAALIETAARQKCPVQATYLFHPDLSAAPFVQISNFAFMLRNLIRQRALQRLAQRAHLTGTGMAFPWNLFAGSDLGAGSLVEDLDLGLSLTDRGHAPVFIETAIVWSVAASLHGTMQQRERWEGGFINNGLPAGLRGLGRSITKLDGRGLIAALDLCIPPLALLALIDGGAFLFAALAFKIGVPFLFLLTVMTAASMAGAAILLAWLFEGRKYTSLLTLVKIPIYVVRKIPLYFRLLNRGPPHDWIRTERD